MTWRAITIIQPYAHLIQIGEKPIENRTWETTYRGPLMIHAGKSREWLEPEDLANHPTMVFGAIVATARLVVCLPKPSPVVTSWNRERWGRYGHLIEHAHAHGPWCWLLADVQPLATPVPYRGMQGLWTPPASLVAEVEAQSHAA